MNGQRVVLGAWLVVAALATVRQISSRPGLPAPGAYVGAGVVYTALFLAAAAAPGLAATMAVGITVAAIFQPYLGLGTGQGIKGTPVLDQANSLLTSIAGGSGPSSGAPHPATPS